MLLEELACAEGRGMNQRSLRLIVVLGANSFSGQDFIDLLLDDPRNRIIGISRSAERSDLFIRYKRRADLSRYRYVQLDLNRHLPQVLRLLNEERPSHLVNFAAQSEVAPSWKHPEQWFQTNTVALAQLVSRLWCQRYLQRYVHISSCEVYGNCAEPVRKDARLNPTTPYAASKAAADLLLSTYQRQFGFPLVTVRATNVYGARQQLHKLMPRCVIYLRQSRAIPLAGNGTARKAYINIRDVSRAELAIMERGDVGGIYHVSPDHTMAVRDVVEEICRRFDRTLAEATVATPARPGEDAAYLLDSTRTRQFGWRPAIDFQTGIDELVRWVDENWEEISAQPLHYVHRP